ncbi:MAG: hypothetical protein HYV33_00130 [Candidatus Kerfeldbacteria bacterium]|nr:hypothetical protein [Candidatus Kerfeldbacteria bacterium]
MDFPQTPPPMPTPVPPVQPPAQPQAFNPVPPPAGSNLNVPVSVAPAPNAAAPEPVYTMPEKFLKGSGTGAAPGKSKKSGWLTWVLIGIIVLAVLGIIGGVAFYFLRNADTNTSVTAVTNQNQTVTEPVNANTNVNATTVTNTVPNTNATNTNVTNINTPVNSNTTTPTNTNTTVTNTVSSVTPSKDTDKDALTNEEEQLYGTKADLPDTDSDGYNDGAEVIAGYDPNNSVSSGRIQDNPIVSNYVNKEFGYTITYPADWIAEALAEGSADEILFTPKALDTAGQFVEVIVEDNPTGFTALDWYVDQTKVDEATLTPITSFGGLAGVVSIDGYTAYYATTDYVYAISYRFGNSKEVHFQSTFTLMAKSFALTKANKKTQSGNSNQNSNTNANSAAS